MTKQAMEIDKIVGTKILEVRKSKNISRKELAENVGITHQQIHKYENGTNRISISRLYQICEYLGINMLYLLDNLNNDKFELNSNSLYIDLIKEIMYNITAINDPHKLTALKNLTESMGD